MLEILISQASYKLVGSNPLDLYLELVFIITSPGIIHIYWCLKAPSIVDLFTALHPPVSHTIVYAHHLRTLSTLRLWLCQLGEWYVSNSAWYCGQLAAETIVWSHRAIEYLTRFLLPTHYPSCSIYLPPHGLSALKTFWNFTEKRWSSCFISLFSYTFLKNKVVSLKIFIWCYECALKF